MNVIVGRSAASLMSHPVIDCLLLAATTNADGDSWNFATVLCSVLLCLCLTNTAADLSHTRTDTYFLGYEEVKVKSTIPHKECWWGDRLPYLGLVEPVGG